MSASCNAAEALACFECVCVTWQSLLGFALPAVVCLVYLPRVVREATVDDWVLLGFTTIFTYATRRVSPDGVAHEPWFVYLAALWAMNARLTDRGAALRSLPLIGVFAFISVAIPDVASMLTERHEGHFGVPGGNGLADGLVLKTAAAVSVTALAYLLKVRPLVPRRSRRGKVYDQASQEFLFNVSPFYVRDCARWEGKLQLISKSDQSRAG